MAEYAAARVAASKPPPLPERLVRRHPPAVRSWRMAVLRYNAWRRASTVAKRQYDARSCLLGFCCISVASQLRPGRAPDFCDPALLARHFVASVVSSHMPVCAYSTLLLDLSAGGGSSFSVAAIRRIAAAGDAGAASALACNTACALLTFWLLWWALAPPPGVGPAMAVRRLCQVRTECPATR